MFGFGRSNKIKKVYYLINQSDIFSNIQAENVFPKKLIDDLFSLSNDVNTTVTIALLDHQAIFAQRFANEAPYKETVESFFEVAKEKELDAETIIKQEARDYIESAKLYGNRIADKLETGKIVANYEVREFCADKAELMLTSYMRYRINLISVYDTHIQADAKTRTISRL